MKAKKLRGGNRPGAGRKPKPAGERKVTLTVALYPKQLEALDRYATRANVSRSYLLGFLIDAYPQLRFKAIEM